MARSVKANGAPSSRRIGACHGSKVKNGNDPAQSAPAASVEITVSRNRPTASAGRDATTVLANGTASIQVRSPCFLRNGV